MTSTQTRTGNVIDVIHADHEEATRLLTAVSGAIGHVREAAFAQLVTALIAHETAEQQVIHPLTRDINSVVADGILEEEQAADAALAHLKEIGATSPDFEAAFQPFQRDVIAHAEREEHEEHPLLREQLSAGQLDGLTAAYEDAKRAASK